MTLTLDFSISHVYSLHLNLLLLTGPVLKEVRLQASSFESSDLVRDVLPLLQLSIFMDVNYLTSFCNCCCKVHN